MIQNVFASPYILNLLSPLPTISLPPQKQIDQKSEHSRFLPLAVREKTDL